MGDDYNRLLGEALKSAAAGRLPDAVRELEALTRTFSGRGEAWNELGVLHYKQNHKADALSCFQRAVDCNGSHARALTNLGACYNDFGDDASAVRCYERALENDPKLADAWGNLGKLWNDQREYEFGAYCYRRALALDRKPLFLRGLGSAYRLSGRYSRAMAAFQEAVEKDPDDGFSHTALAALYFYQEDYPRALAEYEWRWRLSDMTEHRRKYSRLFERPASREEDLSDKTVLIHTEQGYGDNLLFCRYIPLLKQRARRVVMWSWPRLVDLFAENFDLDLVTGDIDALPDFDLSIPLLSLPYHLDPQLKQMAGNFPYLKAASGSATAVGTNPSQLNVGIVWGCAPTGFDYQYKKMPLETLAALTDTPGTRFFSLQLAPDRSELTANPGYPITDLAPLLTDFSAAARVIEQLDLVISVDTAVAHLSAAMGKPTWVLLKKNPDWRWHGYGDRPLWYPDARLFCQHPLDSWESVKRRLHNALKQAARAKEDYKRIR